MKLDQTISEIPSSSSNCVSDVKTIGLKETCSTLRNRTGIKAPFMAPEVSEHNEAFCGVMGGRERESGRSGVLSVYHRPLNSH